MPKTACQCPPLTVAKFFFERRDMASPGVSVNVEQDAVHINFRGVEHVDGHQKPGRDPYRYQANEQGLSIVGGVRENPPPGMPGHVHDTKCTCQSKQLYYNLGNSQKNSKVLINDEDAETETDAAWLHQKKTRPRVPPNLMDLQLHDLRHVANNNALEAAKKEAILTEEERRASHAIPAFFGDFRFPRPDDEEQAAALQKRQKKSREVSHRDNRGTGIHRFYAASPAKQVHASPWIRSQEGEHSNYDNDNDNMEVILAMERGEVEEEEEDTSNFGTYPQFGAMPQNSQPIFEDQDHVRMRQYSTANNGQRRQRQDPTSIPSNANASTHLQRSHLQSNVSPMLTQTSPLKMSHATTGHCIDPFCERRHADSVREAARGDSRMDSTPWHYRPYPLHGNTTPSHGPQTMQSQWLQSQHPAPPTLIDPRVEAKFLRRSTLPTPHSAPPPCSQRMGPRKKGEKPVLPSSQRSSTQHSSYWCGHALSERASSPIFHGQKYDRLYREQRHCRQSKSPAPIRGLPPKKPYHPVRRDWTHDTLNFQPYGLARGSGSHS